MCVSSVWTAQISDTPAASVLSESLLQSVSVPSCSVRFSRPATRWWVTVTLLSVNVSSTESMTFNLIWSKYVFMSCTCQVFKHLTKGVFVFRWMSPGSTWTVWQIHVLVVMGGIVNVSAPAWQRTLNAAATKEFPLTGVPRPYAVSEKTGSKNPFTLHHIPLNW